jgi:hypothetical protein
MFEKIKENLGGILLIGMIAGIATCNIFLNTSKEKEVYTEPKAGDYYVFAGLVDGYGQVFKIKEVRPDSIVFYVPQAKFPLGFKPHKSESSIRQSDQSGKLYGEPVISLSKKEIAQMKENMGLSERLSGASRRLEFVFR